jgi:hypothetical protein
VSAAHVATTEPAAHMSATTKPPAVSTPTTVSTPASPAARERVSPYLNRPQTASGVTN